MSQLGIILQARTGSTRMPEKVILPFYQEQSILDLLLDKVKKLGVPVVLATTVKASDDRICALAAKAQIPSSDGLIVVASTTGTPSFFTFSSSKSKMDCS